MGKIRVEKAHSNVFGWWVICHTCHTCYIRDNYSEAIELAHAHAYSDDHYGYALAMNEK